MFGMGSNPIGDSKFIFAPHLGTNCDSCNTKLALLPSDQSLADLFYVLDSTEEYSQYEYKNYESKCQRAVNIRGNSAVLPFDIIDFAMWPARRSLAGNSGIDRCHVVSR